MNNMCSRSEIESQIEEYNNYDYKTMAWKLVTNDNINGSLLTFFTDEHDNSNNHLLMFELLINISWEMFYDILILNHIDSMDDIKNIRITREMLINYFELIKRKLYLVEINFHYHVEFINNTNHEDIKKICDDRYCRSIIINDPKFRNYFEANRIQNHFHMFLNPNYNVNVTTLSDVYTIMIMDGVLYKIYFSRKNTV